ncbi:unnamed protein product [Chilo suppressalis]|uniref:Uncharacterized protein n=1 Tax=Chilo suppressalis TaxID=168631 RepID=A0ABN8B1X1_CHISP|nr:unnamed protein product [Chilo suppressalis]
MKWNFMLVIVTILGVMCCSSNAQWRKYGGEEFPEKYLSPEDSAVPATDIDHYIERLHLTSRYFNEAPNSTDVSTALCAFYTKSLLKRTIIDYGTKLRKTQTDRLKKIITMCENVISHYVYMNRMYDWSDAGFRVSKLFITDDSQVYSIAKFSRGRLRPWILAEDDHMNWYSRDLDAATLPRDQYGRLNGQDGDGLFHMDMYTSDVCVSRISYNGDPVQVAQLRRCKLDPYCEQRIYSDPSVGYYLTHRFLNAYIRYSKRCYLRSDTEHSRLMERLCAHSYREAVYVARRGFFMRDLFLEHLALCSMLGYEELHRRRWFMKAASWVDGNGCVAENSNYIRNQSSRLKWENDGRTRRQYVSYMCGMSSECIEHAMALVMTVLAHGIRHAAHFMDQI